MVREIILLIFLVSYAVLRKKLFARLDGHSPKEKAIMRDTRITGRTRRLLDIERTEQSVLIEAQYWASTRLSCGCSFECNDGCPQPTWTCEECGDECDASWSVCPGCSP